MKLGAGVRDKVCGSYLCECLSYARTICARALFPNFPELFRLAIQIMLDVGPA